EDIPRRLAGPHNNSLSKSTGCPGRTTASGDRRLLQQGVSPLFQTKSQLQQEVASDEDGDGAVTVDELVFHHFTVERRARPVQLLRRFAPMPVGRYQDVEYLITLVAG